MNSVILPALLVGAVIVTAQSGDVGGTVRRTARDTVGVDSDIRGEINGGGGINSGFSAGYVADNNLRSRRFAFTRMRPLEGGVLV